jgi:hypothetical protein
MNQRILILIGVYVAVILFFAYVRPEKTDWTPSFSPDKTIPFASRVLFNELGEIRTENIQTAERPIYNTTSGFDYESTIVYFFLNYRFGPGSLDIESLLDFASKGNTVFIASENIDHALLDTLGVQLEYEYIGSVNSVEWFYEDNITLQLKGTDGEEWQAAVSAGYQWFIIEDTTLTEQTILGTVNDQHPNFIRCRVGEGTVFLHTFPYMFSNYHMLYQDNYRYVSKALSEVPLADVWIWDKYYLDSTSGRAQSPLAALNKYQSFRWAYWLGIIGAFVFILFTAKRRQRMIPILNEKRNSTLDFVRTIGDLYFHRADHADLIEKKLFILQSQIQKKYRMTVSEFSAEDAKEVAIRAGQDRKAVEILFTQIRNLKSQKTVYAETLFSLQRNLDRLVGRK